MLAELLRSVRYIVDREGKPSAAVVEIATWKRLIQWLDDQEDLAEVREALRELDAAGGDAERAGWLRWEELRGELREPLS